MRQLVSFLDFTEEEVKQAQLDVTINADVCVPDVGCLRRIATISYQCGVGNNATLSLRLISAGVEMDEAIQKKLIRGLRDLATEWLGPDVAPDSGIIEPREVMRRLCQGSWRSEQQMRADKIGVIKMLRCISGAGLRESKDAFEEFYPVPKEGSDAPQQAY